MPSRALHASSPSGAQPVSQPQPRASHLVAEAAGSQQVGLGVLSPPTASSLLEPASGCGMSRRRLGPRGRRGLGGPPDMARSARDAPAATAASFYSRLRGLPQRPGRGRARSEAQHQRGREPPPPPPPAGCVCPRRAGLGWAGLLRSEPRRAPPLGTRACGGSARTLARAPGPQRHAAQPARGPAPAAPGGPGRGGGGGGGGAGAGKEAVSSVPARRPAGSAPRPSAAVGRSVRSSSPGGRP